MGSQINLADILRALEDSSGKSRSSHLENLKHVLRHNLDNHSLEPLNDAAYLRIYESLIRIVTFDRTAYLGAASKTKITASSKLSLSASTLRYIVNISSRTIKSKTVRFVLGHLLSSITTINGFLCEPLALDYAKSIKLLLSHRPHVEHLQQDDWESTASLALRLVQDQQDSADESGDNFDASASRRLIPQARNTQVWARKNTVQITVAKEMISCLRYLTAASNASLNSTAKEQLRSTINFLDVNMASANDNEEAFGLINNILTWAMTENVELIKSMICDILRLVKRYWHFKLPELKIELIVSLVHLQPFVSLYLQTDGSDDATALRFETKALYDIILQDYANRPERDQLQQEDIRLKLADRDIDDKKLIRTSIFALRSGRSGAEHNWTLLSLLAQWSVLLSLPASCRSESGDEIDPRRARKRVRLTLELDDLQSMVHQGPSSSKTTALQIIAFVGQSHKLTTARCKTLLAAIAGCCVEEHASIASWAFLAATSLVTQHQCNHIEPGLTTIAIWQAALRAIANTGTCRAACHYLYVMLHLRLPSHTTTSDLIEQLSASLDIAGPAILSDSSASLLTEILLLARTSLPGLIQSLVQRVIAWFTKNWTPSKFETRTHLSFIDLYDMIDIRRLVSCALDQDCFDTGTPVHEWTAIGVALVQAAKHDEILAYLLLRDSDEQFRTPVEGTSPRSVNANVNIPAQTTLLVHITEELSQLIETFNASFAMHARNLTTEASRSFCTACHFALLVSHDLSFVDAHRRQQLQTLSNTLLQAIESCASIPDCRQPSVDTILRLSTQTLYRRDASGSLLLSTGSPGAVLLANSLLRILAQRRQHDELMISQELDHQLTFATDPYESQDSRKSSQNSAGLTGLNPDLGEYSTHALRCTVSIHALILGHLDSRPLGAGNVSSLSTRITEYVSSAPNSSGVFMLQVLGRDLTPSLDFTQDDVECILGLASSQIISTYTHSRSTMALSSVIDFMVKTVLHWTDSSNTSLSNLGLDLYEWFINLTLVNKVLAPPVQRKTADLSLAICRQDPDYGSQTAEMSARTSVFRLLRKGPISVQFHLAPRLSTIFKLYSVSTHDQIFDDLQRSLPVDPLWLEGIAMRLYILAELGSTWHSLLRRCVYYIFETAGQVSSAVSYAKRCIARLTASLSLDSSVKLFALFCPQLLHTWLDGHSLQDLPFAIFDYPLIETFLSDNQEEIAAQLFLRQRQGDLVVVAEKVGKSVVDLLSHAIDRVLAYTFGQDTTNVTSATKQTATCESRLREIVGKDRLKTLVLANYGAVIGRILLAANREESDEKWLEKGDTYSSAAVALSDMKKYSQSTRTLPPSQEPHFTSKYLLHQLERLARRVGYTSTSGLWNASSYTLVSQMLFDSIDDALGSLHSCTVLQTLRLLIALAEQTPLEGYPLEHTLRLLLPFLDDEQCADDVIGICHYLLSKSIAYLSEHWTTLWSVSINIVLRLTRFDSLSRQTPTQTSQQRETLLRMQKFRSWLLAYLANITSTLPDRLRDDAKTVSGALARSTLPGNARRDSPESTLMLFLLKQQASATGLLDPDDVREAIKFLAADFELPDTHAEDCLSADVQAVAYVKSLWTASQDAAMDSGFVLWSALVAGRVFAATGSPELFNVSTIALDYKTPSQDFSRHHRPQQIIAEHLQSLLRSSQTQIVSVALSTMRACMAGFSSEADRLAFQQLFPSSTIDAIANASSKYHRVSAAMPQGNTDDQRLLEDVLALDISIEMTRWITKVALSICNLPQGSAFLGGLSLLLNNDSAAARSLLPSIIHLVLLEDTGNSTSLRNALSSSLQAHLSGHDELLIPKQRFLIEVLLYLLNQTYPGEVTMVDRMKWLECEYITAAKCAVRCQMPTTALMLAEMARTTAPVNKRASSRAPSVLQNGRMIPNDLLLSIFQQVSEPDSYYGVEQPASLHSFLERSEYEGNALQALISRSAQLDNNLRTTHSLQLADTTHMMNSLSTLNLDSLTFALAHANSANVGGSTAVVVDTARVLQQWDINIPDQQDANGIALYRAFHTLNHATERGSCIDALKGFILSHVKQYDSRSRLSLKWASALASMTEILRVTTDPEALGSSRLCDLLHEGNTWMELEDFDSLQTLVQSRSTIAGVLSGNKNISESLQVAPSQVKLHEAKALVMLSDLARKHDRNELAMSAAWQLNSLATDNLGITAMAQREIASVLSSVGESAASIRILRDLATANSVVADEQLGQSGLLSQIGQQLADARLETPSEILQNYLKPSIEQLQSDAGAEAGQVFYTFAAFCDAQLQNAGALADFHRLSKLRQAKHDETVQLKAHLSSLKRHESEYKVQKRSYERALQWYEIDNAEYIKARNNREIFAEQSLKNYMHTLRAYGKHDLCVLRLFALWLEYSDSKQTQATVSKHLPQVPTWKFVLLMNQLMSRLKGDKSEFDKTLLALLRSVCHDHPYHTVHHLYAARKFPGEDQASQMRRTAAEQLCQELVKEKPKGDIIRRMLKADSLYKMLAQESREGKTNGQYPVEDSVTASKISRHLPREQVPPATVEVALQPDGVYDNVPVVTGLGKTLTIMTGLSAPKVLTVFSSDGKQCKQLFKGGNDDLRQDAIMEQVFGEVSKMLRNHKASRQRNLQVRTYKVIPLTNRAGIIEFVPNSIPINDFLQPAHQKYYPSSIKVHAARQKISAVAEQSTETRVKEFRKVCEQMPPVLRHFFFERFVDPDEWFSKRTAYTRTTATISMLGQILGLGDRHCHNILLDEHSGEVIHIDLGVAFEAGRVLPIPELVPFRLTRDIVDGMGVTGTEGIFKRCAEFTLDALRKDKDDIMTLLNVLRYDPLYSWTLSPIKAKRMQQQEGETTGTSGNGVLVSNKTESEAGEAERALSIVEKKLGNALSTAASVSEMIQQATDDRNLATLFSGWAAFF